MNLQETYKYSWFSSLSYVRWDNSKNSNSDKRIEAAKDAKRIPGNMQQTGKINLANEIFDRYNWTIDHFEQNDPDTGFAASLYSNANDKGLFRRIYGCGLF